MFFHHGSNCVAPGMHSCLGNISESQLAANSSFQNVCYPPEDCQQRRLRRFLCFIDIALVCLSTSIALELDRIYVRPSSVPLPFPSFYQTVAGVALVLSLFTILIARVHGLYDFPLKKRFRTELAVFAKALISAGLVGGSCVYLWKIQAISIVPFVASIAASWSALGAWRWFVRSQSISGLTQKRNVLIVGCGPNGVLLRKHLEQNTDIGYVFKGYIDRRNGGRAADPVRNSEEGLILGMARDLPEIARREFIDEVFISVPSDRNLVKDVARHAQSAGLHVRVVPDLYDGLATGNGIEYVGLFPTMTVNRLTIPTVQLIVKRILDIIVSSGLLILLLPLFLLISLLIKLDSRGPIFYRSLRVGKKGTTFNCLKFRTMVANADKMQQQLAHLNERKGILFKISRDPRITRVGRFLRRFSLDELPQLWNVLRQDMSLVGPRPSIPGEYSQYALEHLRRLDVVPGITGLWQVTARRDPSFENYISLDKKYVDNWTFSLDCKILLKTIGVVLAGTGQ